MLSSLHWVTTLQAHIDIAIWLAGITYESLKNSPTAAYLKFNSKALARNKKLSKDFHLGLKTYVCSFYF